MNDEVKVKAKADSKFPVRALTQVIAAMFAVGLAVGACELGVKVPVALFNLAVYYSTP